VDEVVGVGNGWESALLPPDIKEEDSLADVPIGCIVGLNCGSAVFQLPLLPWFEVHKISIHLRSSKSGSKQSNSACHMLASHV
jgi:hypothetical protein